MASSVERIGDQSLLVHRNRDQPQPQQASQRPQPWVGQRLGRQGIAGLGQRANDASHGVLTAGRHDDLFGRRSQPAQLQQSRPCEAVLATAGRRLVVEETGEVGLGGQPLQSRRHRRILAGGAGPVGAEIDEIGVRRLARSVAGHDRSDAGQTAHIGPAANLAGNQPAPLGLGIRATDRSDCHLQSPGEIAMSREPRAGGEPAASHVFGEGVGDGAIPRSIAAG